MPGAETLLALSHPLVVALLGCAVLLIWHYDATRARYLLYFGIAYLAYSFAATAQITGIPSYLPLNILLSGILYIAAITLLTHGLVMLAGRRYQYIFPVIVGVLMMAGRIYFTLVEDDTKLRLYLLSGAIFLILLHGTVLARNLLQGGRAEKVLYLSFLGVTLSTIPRVLSGLSRPAGAYGFDSSVYWLVTQFSVYVFSIVFMLSLIFTIMQKRILAQRELSETDILTGLRNRRGFLVTVMRRISRLDSYAVIVADIDRFKTINDTYGHAVGDDVLIETAKIIDKSIRPADVSGRIGGEEFAIFLPETTAEDGYEVAERLRRNFEQFNFLHEKLNIKCTISLGVAAFGRHMPIAQALTVADRFLYQAKASGRNQVACNTVTAEVKIQESAVT